MKINMGSADRIIRILIASALIIIFFTKTVTGIAGWICLGVAVIFILTSLIGFCPLYRLLGIRTCPRKNNQEGS